MKPFVLLVVGLVLYSAISSAQIPRTMSYQAVLTDSTGAPKSDGPYLFTFRLYEASSGGSAVSTQQQTLQVRRGLFYTVFDQLLNGLSIDHPYWLSLQIESEAELLPRIPLTSVPYSISSIRADTARYALTIASNAGWSLTGNAGTVSGTNFIGTTDDIPLTIRVNNQQAGRISGTGPTFLGYQAGNSNTASPSVGIGYRALFSNTTGVNNTANGYQALSSNTTGDNNTASGYYALPSNTIGSNNTASGYNALFFNTTGSLNTASGVNALSSNTSGYFNTASGVNALYSNTIGTNNTATGHYALFSNTTGTYNTATGDQALRFNNESYNAACGTNALYGTTASQYNVAVGYNAGALHDNGYNNVFIGADADVNGVGYYNVIAIGRGTVVTGPSAAVLGNSSTVSYSGYANWSNISDGRYKNNIKENVPGLNFINKLRPVTYNLDATGLDAFLHKNNKEREQGSNAARAIHNKALLEKEAITYTGFVAQEVEAAAKELGYDFSGVDAPRNENGTYGLRYAEFVVPLVKAVQEQQKEIEELKAMVKSLSEARK